MSVAAGIDRNPTIAKILSEYFPTAKDRSNARVLDLAAGTGLVGRDLYKVGFTSIDAVGKWLNEPVVTGWDIYYVMVFKYNLKY